MTDKEFVLSIYPTAYFNRGSIIIPCGQTLWEDEYGIWAENWNDTVATEKRWHNFAEYLRRQFLKKLES